MEMLGHDRQTILPPPPSPSRMFLLAVSAFVARAAAGWRRRIDALAKCARSGLLWARPHGAPSPVPHAPEVERPTTDMLGELRRQPPLCLSPITADEASQPRPTVTTVVARRTATMWRARPLRDAHAR